MGDLRFAHFFSANMLVVTGKGCCESKIAAAAYELRLEAAAHWLGRRSLAGGLSLICAASINQSIKLNIS